MATQLDGPTILSQGLNLLFNFSKSFLVQNINYYVSGTNIGSVYDDVLTQTMTGSTWMSGIIMPVNGKQGSEEALLIEQGKLSVQDKMLVLSGGAVLNSSGLLIGVGSPNPVNYTLVPIGDFYYEMNGVPVYKKLYIRKIPGTAGSLY